MRTKKYLVIGDYIYSKNDGDKHYIYPTQLIRLYGVDPQECVVIHAKELPQIGSTYRDLIELRPRYDGNYKLEDK